MVTVSPALRSATLALSGVSVEYCYAFISHSNDDAHVILRVDNDEKAVKALAAAGCSFLSGDKYYR